MTVLLLLLAAGAVLLALAWWSSGRSRKRFPGGAASHDVARGHGAAQGMTRHDHGSHGGL